MSFYSVIDTSFLGDFDIRALQREQEIDELIIDLTNYTKDVDYCDAVKRRRDGSEPTRRELRERINSITDDAQQIAQDLAQRIRDGVNEGDDSTELPPKKDQAREGARPGASNTEATVS